jgi:nitrite reductase (NADH) small subunit/3-phenylpropionate/trans-cinnamate dioxygenase ferredoxin subunit
VARFHKVARTGEIPPGTGRTVDLGGVKVALFNVEGAYHAIDDTCPHQGGSLGEGILSGCVVTCPYHFWQFDVTKGQAPEFPEARVGRFAVKVEGEEISVCDVPLGEEI